MIKMASKRKSGGKFDFVAPDNELEHLDNKLGKHAKIGGRKPKEKPVITNDLYWNGEPPKDEFALERERERKEFFEEIDEPFSFKKIKKIFKKK